jgi:hypothetical protein
LQHKIIKKTVLKTINKSSSIRTLQKPEKLSKTGQWMRDNQGGIITVLDRKAVYGEENIQTITLQYDVDNTILKKVFEIALSLGAVIAETPLPEKNLSKNDDVLSVYQNMYGKRKGNKYTENEMFVVNSKINSAKSFAKYL